MGIGDEIMAAGHAMRESRRIGAPVRIVDKAGRTRWHELWEGNPHISRDDAGPSVTNGPGCRPYIRYPFTIETGQRFSGWRARDHRAAIYGLPAVEKRGYVVIEPTLKQGANPNKQWHGWRRLVDMLDCEFVQLGPTGDDVLPGVRWIKTPSFRDACVALSAARAAILPEGGLHHACAALNIPAVVIFGGATSVEATGYPEHVNIGGDNPCGKWTPCPHCAGKMGAITPESVAVAFEEMLNGQAYH